MTKKTKKILIGTALMILPGSGIFIGGYLVYKAIKKRPKTLKEFIETAKKELEEDIKNGNA